MHLTAFFGEGVSGCHQTLKRDHGTISYEPWTRVLGALTEQLFAAPQNCLIFVFTI